MCLFVLVSSITFCVVCVFCFFFFKQKTAYEMRISDWSSDVCSSDLGGVTSVAAVRVTAPDHAPGVVEYLPRARTLTCSAEPGMTGERSEERRVGKESVSTCRYRWSPYH